MKKILQKANKYLLFTDITLINTLILINILNEQIVNNFIDKITIIY